MKSMKLLRLLFLSVMLALLVACGQASAPVPAIGAAPGTIAVASKSLDSASALPQIGELAPDFEYTLADGATRRLSDLRGKKVLVNFWASWCGPCREEMPAIQRALGQYGDSVAVLGVNKLEDFDTIKQYAGEVKVDFPLIANPTGDITTRYRVAALPISYFINSDGTIGARQIGVMDYDTLKQKLDSLK